MLEGIFFPILQGGPSQDVSLNGNLDASSIPLGTTPASLA